MSYFWSVCLSVCLFFRSLFVRNVYVSKPCSIRDGKIFLYDDEDHVDNDYDFDVDLDFPPISIALTLYLPCMYPLFTLYFSYNFLCISHVLPLYLHCIFIFHMYFPYTSLASPLYFPWVSVVFPLYFHHIYIIVTLCFTWALFPFLTFSGNF